MATVLPFDAAGIHLDPAQGLARQLYAALRGSSTAASAAARGCPPAANWPRP